MKASLRPLHKSALSSSGSALLDAVVFILTLALCLLAAEGVLRLRNADQRNYNIEMWRYSKLLKMRSDDPVLGHEHRPNAGARLQNVDIRINSLGLRGPETDAPAPGQKRLLLLGSSNTLGWGVAEDDTLAVKLQQIKGGRLQVLNAGIGNYNAERYVRRFEKKFLNLRPDIVVVHYFIRDAEVLEQGGGNFWLRNSQLAVTLHHLLYNLTFSSKDPTRLVEHYKRMYAPGSPGLQAMERALGHLNQLAQENRFRVILTMVPDIHAVSPYPFTFIHEHMRELAKSMGWTYVDFAEGLNQVPQKDLWVMPGDPHINARGQQIMADTLAPYLD